MSVCTGAPDCPAGEHIHGCYRNDRYRATPRVSVVQGEYRCPGCGERVGLPVSWVQVRLRATCHCGITYEVVT